MVVSKGEGGERTPHAIDTAGGGDSATTRGKPDGTAAGGGSGGGLGGGGGGGGGNKKGGRPSKLPSCSLPNNMQPTFYIGGGNGTAL